MPETKLMFHINKGCEDKVLKINIIINQLRNEHLFEVCPYNRMHIFHKNIINQHIDKCPDNVNYRFINSLIKIFQKIISIGDELI